MPEERIEAVVAALATSGSDLRPFEARIEVPKDAVEAVDLAKLVPSEQLARLGLQG